MGHLRGRYKARGNIVHEACRRFPSVSNSALARYILYKHGPLFDDNFELILTAVRAHRGTQGHSSVLDPIPRQPESKSTGYLAPYNVPAGTWAFLTDLHVPFHDRNAIEAAIEYARVKTATGLIISEIQDCASIGFWPTRERDFLEEVEYAIDMLDWLRSAGLPIIYKLGNHEARLDSYYRKHAPQLVDMPTATLQEALALEERGIDVVYPNQLMNVGRLKLLHGHELRGSSIAVNPARWLFLKTKGSAICGHWHRTSQHDETNIKDELITCWSVGCLCDLHPEYAPFCNNWNHGFAIIHVDDKGMYEVENRRIIDSKRVV